MNVRILPILLGACLFWPVTAAHANLNNCGNSVVNNDEECDDGNDSSTDGCNTICDIVPGWTCTGSPSVCTQTSVTCGNGTIESGEECDDANTDSGDGCQSDCTVQSGFECTGSPSVCLPGEPTADCGNGTLDIGEDCDGGPCCIDCSFATSTTTCRASEGACDVAEVCNGSSGSCPADAHRTSVCRASTGACDAPESCSTLSDDCPADSMRPSTFVCRAATGSCDVAETCNGSTSACPVDTMAPAATVCRAAVAPACDVAESCSGTSGTCPDDILLNCPDTDGIDCVRPACDMSGQCVTDDQCNEICRDANFWSKRLGTTKKGGTSVVDDILDDVGSISVCGQIIDSSSDLGELDSVVEALCAKAGGSGNRALFRQLVTTELNCAISEGGTCEDIVGRSIEVSLADCDALCAGQPVTNGPTMDECIDQLACYNRGGQVVDGDCALGTCEDDPTELCGGDFGSCSSTSGSDDGDDDDGDADDDDDDNDVVSGVAAAAAAQHGLGSSNGHGKGLTGSLGNGSDDANDEGDDDEADDDSCEPFEDSCAGARICSGDGAAADVCPGKVRPSSQKICQAARKNDCTIDDCN